LDELLTQLVSSIGHQFHYRDHVILVIDVQIYDWHSDVFFQFTDSQEVHKLNSVMWRNELTSGNIRNCEEQYDYRVPWEQEGF